MQVTTNDMILFWQTDTVYSNWYQPVEFEVWGQKFLNSEAAFMYGKAMAFKDDAVCTLILANQDPKTVKRFGRQVKNFDEEVWKSVRVQVMYEACFAKFWQNPVCLKEILASGNRTLVEASPLDKIWGIGLAPNDPLALNYTNWKGENLLGQVLMDVRYEIRNILDNSL